MALIGLAHDNIRHDELLATQTLSTRVAVRLLKRNVGMICGAVFAAALWAYNSFVAKETTQAPLFPLRIRCRDKLPFTSLRGGGQTVCAV